uniref:Transmembrane and coiled-coil domain-containing protein 4 n=1 Tax=Vitis vinifera TaxID=29760 RepID=F6GWS7_VITVI
MNKPVTLTGYSLGARVIFKCLQYLAKTEQNGMHDSLIGPWGSLKDHCGVFPLKERGKWTG